MQKWCDPKHKTDLLAASQGFMESVLQSVSFVSYLLRSNFLGLGCPAHCGVPGTGAVLASFLLGLLVGFVLCGCLAWYLSLDFATGLPSFGTSGPSSF